MKTKLLITLGLAAVMLPLPAHAQEQMVVYGQSGQPLMESDLSGISSLTPAGDAISVKLRSGKLSAISLTDIRSIKFIQGTTAIEKLTTNGNKLSFTVGDGQITVGGWNGKDGSLFLYSADGSLVTSARHWAGEPVNIASLASGLYILKVNNQSFKFIK